MKVQRCPIKCYLILNLAKMWHTSFNESVLSETGHQAYRLTCSKQGWIISLISTTVCQGPNKAKAYNNYQVYAIMAFDTHTYMYDL